MHVLTDLGLQEALSKVSFEPNDAIICDGVTGKTLSKTSLRDESHKRYGAPYIHIHRADLHSILLHAALKQDIEISLGEEVEGVVQDDHMIKTKTKTSAYESDLVIAADGGRSRHQINLNPNASFAFRGQVAWRGTVPTHELPLDLIKPDATVWIGPKHHFVSYYIRGGSLVNFVAVQERTDWTNADWHQDGNIEELRDAFKNWHPTIVRILEACTQTNLWALYDSDPLPNWVDGRLALLGDAAHPMLPFMAQGAGMAIEDAYVLAECLKHEDIPQALKTYQNRRKRRTAMVQKMARSNAKLFHRSQGLSDIVQNTKLALGGLFPELVRRELDKIYGVDVTKEPYS